MLTQGMAKKLMDHQLVPSADTLLVPGEGFVDVKRTHELWNNTFLANKSLAKRDGWVDDASVGIPDLYVISGMTLAEALARQGKTAASDSVFLSAKAVARAMKREAIFGIDRMQGMPVAPGDTAIAPLLTAPPAAPAPAPPPAKKP